VVQDGSADGRGVPLVRILVDVGRGGVVLGGVGTAFAVVRRGVGDGVVVVGERAAVVGAGVRVAGGGCAATVVVSSWSVAADTS
jgi:hypothetical protein